jgi:alpha-mannosidase
VGNQRRHVGTLSPFQIKQSWDSYRQKDINNEVFTPFDWGDGGGGPTVEMIETARVLQNIPGMPHVRMSTVEEFCTRLRSNLGRRTLAAKPSRYFFHRRPISKKRIVNQRFFTMTPSG